MELVHTRLIKRESQPVRCDCPTNSDKLCGRRRSASGAAAESLLVFVRFEGPASAVLALGAARFLSENEELRVGVAVTLDALGVFGAAPALKMGATALDSFVLLETCSEDGWAAREELLSAQLLSRCALMSRSATLREHIGLL